MTLKICI